LTPHSYSPAVAPSERSLKKAPVSYQCCPWVWLLLFCLSNNLNCTRTVDCGLLPSPFLAREFDLRVLRSDAVVIEAFSFSPSLADTTLT